MNAHLEIMSFISLLRTIAFCTTFLILLTLGEPDLLDAIITLINSLAK